MLYKKEAVGSQRLIESDSFVIYNVNVVLASVSFFYYIPVYDIPKSSNMVSTSVLVVEIICMFPNIETEDWL